MYTSLVAAPEVLRSLNRIANNAYPGFRPATSGGEARSSSSASDKKTRNPPPVLERGGTRGAGGNVGGKGNGQGRAPPALAYNLIKPCSPESRLISELATEVAYLVGTPARRTSPKTPPSTCGQQEPAPLVEQPHEQLSSAKEPVESTAKRKHAIQGARFGPASPTGQASAVELEDGEFQAHEKQVSVIPPNTRGGRGVGVVSGRPGTYFGCGITSCKGLGFAGEHGDVDGNSPHGAFVLRKADNRDGGVESTPCDNSTRGPSGVIPGSDATSANVENAPYEHDTERRSTTASPDVVVATQLALLSAREPSFRKELIRRKQHYGLGGTGKKLDTSAEKKRGKAPLEEPVLEPDKRKTHSEPAVGMERGRSTKPLRRPRTSRQHSGGGLPSPVDVSESPLMASTRPAGVQPALGSPRADATRQNKDNLESLRGKFSRQGSKEFITFARPAAHWSVTKSLSASPGETRSKGIRVPEGTNDGGAGLVVGRFACRGYLLDPTFSGRNPVILHPRLPLIAGGAGGFSQVPEDSTLGDLVASPADKLCPIGGGAGVMVEPYRNVVEVLRHNVGISGGRPAAEKI